MANRQKPNRAPKQAKTPKQPTTPKREPTPKVVQDIATRCQKDNCNSTEREPYFGVIERYLPGRDENGLPYTHVIWRRTRCKKCGQARRDISRENRS